MKFVSGAWTANSSGTSEFTQGTSGVRIAWTLVVCVCFVDTFVVVILAIILSVHLDLRILITSLVSSNFVIELQTITFDYSSLITFDSPRFLCLPTTLYIFARAVERQSAIYTENSGFASPTLGQHISTFRGYRILFSIRNPCINLFTNHFSIHS